MFVKICNFAFLWFSLFYAQNVCPTLGRTETNRMKIKKNKGEMQPCLALENWPKHFLVFKIGTNFFISVLKCLKT
jgi:hypothetical protein